MKFPRKPPNWRDSLVNLFQSEEKRSLVLSCEVPSKYLHWDKLRHRKPPDGLSAEEWWTALKLRRSSQCRPIPLCDLSGSPFSYFVTEAMFKMLHTVDLNCGGTVEMPDQITNPDTRDRYYVASLMEESITSSILEGAAVTRADAKEMLRSGRKPADKSERMILNNYLTMRRIGELKNEPLSTELILELHRRVTRQTLQLDDQEGRFRKVSEDIRVEDPISGAILHRPPPTRELAHRMRAMCDFANEREMKGFLHPVVRSIIVHFWLAYDHPFVDGNGRTARALFYWSMLRHGFWLFEFISISQILLKAPVRYARSFLYTETDDNDLNYFIICQLEVIVSAIDELHAYIDRKTRELTETRQQLRDIDQLNHRQIAVIQRALRFPNTQFTVKSHKTSQGVVYQTARTDLLKMEELGLLEKRTRGSEFVFAVPHDLTERIGLLGV